VKNLPHWRDIDAQIWRFLAGAKGSQRRNECLGIRISGRKDILIIEGHVLLADLLQ